MHVLRLIRIGLGEMLRTISYRSLRRIISSGYGGVHLWLSCWGRGNGFNPVRSVYLVAILTIRPCSLNNNPLHVGLSRSTFLHDEIDGDRDDEDSDGEKSVKRSAHGESEKGKLELRR